MKKLQFVLIPAIILVIGGLAFSFLFEDKHVAKGRKVFSRYCTPCHGEGGQGDGYNAKNLDPHARDLTDGAEEYMAKLTNEEIYEVIELGGYGVELSPGMPTWGKHFSEEEIWSVVAYIRTLHPYDGPPIIFDKEKPYQTARPRTPPVQEAEFISLFEEKVADDDGRQEMIDQGKEVFADRGCVACHQINGKGGELGPDLSRVGFMLQPQFIYRWVRNPLSFKPHTRMPNLDLSDEEALAVTIYLSTLKGSSNDVQKAEPHQSGGDPSQQRS